MVYEVLEVVGALVGAAAEESQFVGASVEAAGGDGVAGVQESSVVLWL